jgi:hypothetical protein
MALPRSPKVGTLWQNIGARVLSHLSRPISEAEIKAQVSYLMCTPEMAREITNRWISDVPSKMV